MFPKSLNFCLPASVGLFVLTLCLAAQSTLAGDGYEMPSFAVKKAFQGNSVDAIVSSTDGQFLMAKKGDLGFIWNQDTLKLVSEVSLEKYHRSFLGPHGFLGTVDLDYESKRDKDANEYNIELISPAAPTSVAIVSHVPASRIDTCALSPSGDKLFFVSRNGGDKYETASIVDVKTGKALRRFVSPEDFFRFAWTNTEETLIISADSELQLFKLNGMSDKLALEPDFVSNLQSSLIWGIVATEQQEVLVTSHDCKLRIYKLDNNTLRLRSTIDLGGVRAEYITYNKTLRTAALYSSYGKAYSLTFIDIDSEKFLMRLGVPFRGFFESGKSNSYVAVVDDKLRKYSLESCLNTVNPIAKSADSSDSQYYGVLGFEKAGDSLIRASKSGFSRWQIKDLSIEKIGNHTLDSFGLEDDEFLCLSASSGYLVRSSNNLYQCNWDKNTNSVKNTLLLRFPSKPKSYDGNSQSLIRFRDSKNDRYRLAVLDSSGKFSKIIDPSEGWEKASILPDGSLCAVSDGHMVSLLDATGNERFSKECEVDPHAPPRFSSDQRIIVYGPSQIDIESGEVQLVYPFSGMSGMAVSPTNAITAYGHSDGAIFLFNQSTKQVIGALESMNGSVTSLAFHPSGRLLATLDEYGEMAVWDLASFNAQAEGKPVPVKITELEMPLTFKHEGLSVSVTGDATATQAAVSAALRAALRKVEER